MLILLNFQPAPDSTQPPAPQGMFTFGGQPAGSTAAPSSFGAAANPGLGAGPAQGVFNIGAG